jgi:hypothetical protein
MTQDEIANDASYSKAASDSRYINYDGDIVNGTIQIGGSGNNITFADNNKAIFGDGDDLQIYHSGTHSWITNSTGYLHINAANIELKNAADNETMLLATQNGAVKLSYDNSVKLATTSTGIDVTGNIIFGDNHAIVSDGNDNLVIESSSSEDIIIKAGSGVIEFRDAGESGSPLQMKIDTDGNVLVGGNVNDTTPYNNSAGSTADNGIALGSSGIISAAKYNDSVLLLNRTGTNDGPIIDVKKNGNTVGTIGTVDSDLNVYATASGHKGLRFGNGYLAPTGNSTTVENGTTDLGLSTHRFKDLYMTGTANIGDIKLDAIAKDISDTAVDVFIYDTRKDSDGGAWRKRTQHTSWYNETLNTATRGARKEFPAVAVIVAEEQTLTIYDGDDPDMPMWLVFDNTNSSGNALVATGANRNWTSAQMFNGRLAVGMGYRDTDGMGIDQVDFIIDGGWRIRTGGGSSYKGTYKGNIAQRRDTTFNGIVLGTLVNETVNDVAMTVLPNAPIDAATGLPVPTIAVATAANVSIIRDNGTVVDITYANYNDARNIYFNSKNHLIYSHYNSATQSAAKVYYEIPSSDLANPQGGYQRGAETVYYAKSGISPDINLGDTLHISDISENSFGTSEKLILTDETTPPTSSMINFIASDYNTGWMNGDIKLATLSDTDDTNITFADKQLIDEPYFNASTGWYFNGNGASGAGSTTGNGWSISGGKITQSGSGGDFYAVIPVVNGRQYVMQLTFDTTGTSSFNNVSWGFRSLANSGYLSVTQNQTSLVGNTANQTKQVFWTANTTGNIIARVYCDAALSIDNFTVHIAEEDRSANGKGLQVFGTVTKTAVATGAELMGYSGFSSGNYLQQPYNSDLDFGTGDFSATFWFNGSGAGNTNLWERGAATGQNFGILTVNGYIYLTGFGANIPIGSPHANAGDASWGHVVLLRKAGVWNAYLNGNDTAWAYTNAANLTNTSAVLHLGGNVALTSFANAKKLALMRFSPTVPSAEQIKKMYNDEKHLFQENAKATLYGTSDAVTALAYDDDTELLHVGTSAGRSVFQGLRRIDNTTDAVGAAISASNGMVAED